MDRRNWKFKATCYKAFKRDGKMHVRATASDSLEDRTGDRISEKAIHSMVKQVNSRRIGLLDHHDSSFTIGEIVEGRSSHTKSKVKFDVDIELKDQFPQAVELYKDVKNGTNTKQLSIGGFVDMDKEGAIEFEEKKNGKVVRVINDIELEHIANTRGNMAANPRTGFSTAIIKSMGFETNEDGDKMDKDKKKKIVNDKVKKSVDEDDEAKGKNENKKTKKKKDEDVEKDTRSREQKLHEIVVDVVEMHKQNVEDGNEIDDETLKTLQETAKAISDFVSQIEKSKDDDIEKEDDENEDKEMIDTRLDELAGNVAKGMEAVSRAVTNLEKKVSNLSKSSQKSGRIRDDDDDDEEGEETVFKGLMTPFLSSIPVGSSKEE